MADLRETGSAFSPAEGEARAKLFMHGGSQAVRLPKAFRFEGSEVSVRREGEAVILEPVAPKRPPTAEEIEALWRRVDAVRSDTPLEPPGRHDPWRDVPLW